jgi:segregation and condensation protein A
MAEVTEPFEGDRDPAAAEPDSSGAAVDAPETVAETGSGRFTVKLSNFEGPFDLLLQLIGKHKLEITEVSLHRVTDDFIAHIRAMGNEWDLDEVSEFLVIAATLLDLKAARLLPSAEIDSEEDLALLEARDLLFARLLQYRAYKQAAAYLAELEAIGGRRWPRLVSLEPQYADALPELVLGIGPARLAKLALRAFAPKVAPTVSIAHIHQVRVSVREHAATLRDRLRELGLADFGALTVDCDNTLEVVARFLALLELYREGLIDFEQPDALERLVVRWIAADDGSAADFASIDEYDDQAEPDAEAGTAAGSGGSASDEPADPDDPDGPVDAGPAGVHDDMNDPVNDSTGKRQLDDQVAASGGASSDADA